MAKQDSYRQESRHAPVIIDTVGDLKAMLEGIPDESPIRGPENCRIDADMWDDDGPAIVKINRIVDHAITRWARRNALNIAIACAILAALFMLAAFAWQEMRPAPMTEEQLQHLEYVAQVERDYNTPEGRRAWKRLERKHGRPGAVIYEPGKDPYYVNAAGQKCRFI